MVVCRDRDVVHLTTGHAGEVTAGGVGAAAGIQALLGDGLRGEVDGPPGGVPVELGHRHAVVHSQVQRSTGLWVCERTHTLLSLVVQVNRQNVSVLVYCRTVN